MTDERHEMVSLREYVEAELRSIRREAAERQRTTELAVAKAEESMQHRFESVNEFRAQLGDQTASFITRDQVLRTHEEVDRRLAKVESALANLQGRAVAGAVMMSIAAATMAAVFTHLAGGG